MNTLTINYRELSSVTSAAKKISRSLENRISDYEGIATKINSIPSGSTNNLSQANYYLRKKTEKLQNKKDSVDKFVITVDRLADTAESTDKRVANRIKSSSKSFRKANDLEVTFIGFLQIGLEDLAKSWLGNDFVNALTRTARNLKYQIKDWYHEDGGKYVVETLISAAVAVASVAALAAAITSGAGAIALFFAGFQVFNSVSEYYYDCQSASCYSSTSDKITADRLSEKGGKDVTSYWGGEGMALLAKFTDQDVDEWRRAGQASGNIVYEGVSMAATVYNIFGMGKSAKEFFLGKDFKFGKFFNDLKDNAQYGELTFGQILLENVNSSSTLKFIKDYGIVKSLLPNMTTWDHINTTKELLFKDILTADSSTLSGMSKNIKTIKSILKGDNSYNLPNRIRDKMNSIRNHASNMTDEWNSYMNPQYSF